VPPPWIAANSTTRALVLSPGAWAAHKEAVRGCNRCVVPRDFGNSSPELVKPPCSGAVVARVFSASKHGINSALAFARSLVLD
jgi:hypothetical protein